MHELAKSFRLSSLTDFSKGRTEYLMVSRNSVKLWDGTVYTVGDIYRKSNSKITKIDVKVESDSTRIIEITCENGRTDTITENKN